MSQLNSSQSEVFKKCMRLYGQFNNLLYSKYYIDDIPYDVIGLTNVDTQKYVLTNEGLQWVSLKDDKITPSNMFKVIGITPCGKTISSKISQEMAESGLIDLINWNKKTIEI